MANPIRYTDLADKADIDAGFNSLIKHYADTEKFALKTISRIEKASKGLVPTGKGAGAEVAKQTTNFRTQKKVVDESQKAIKALTAAHQKLKIANSEVGIETERVKDAISRQSRNTKQAITLENSRKGSMTALNVTLGKNRQRYRELSAAQRANANVGGKLLTTIKQQDANIKKLDASIGNNQRSIGNYGTALKGVTQLMGALGLAGGIALVVRGMKDMIGVFSGFEKQMAKVRAVSRATDEEFDLLVADAKRLGESTEQTATSVGELQLAYAKLGLTTPQIIAATEATLDLATATDEDLAQSALVAAKTVQGFGLLAEDTTRVTDVMAASFSMSALNLSAFQDAMKSVAPVAKAVDSSLESTTAVLSTLIDAGLDASTSGTSLRNIFIELASKGISWDDAMEQVRVSTNKVKTATDLFGKRAASAAIIIADNSEKIDSLTESYENAQGSAKAMADIMRDTLIGDTDKATSAIQGMVIQIGEKLTPALRAIVKGFTFFITNIKTFAKIIGIAGAGLIAYTLITKGAAIAKGIYTAAVNIARIATKAFNTSVKASPLGLIIGLLAAAAAAYFTFKDEITGASKAQDDFNEKHKSFLDELAKEEAQLKTLFDAAKTAKEGTEERTFAIAEINKLYGKYLDNLLTERSSLEDIAVAQEIANKALIQEIAIKSKRAEITEANIKLIKAQKQAQDFITKSTDNSRLALAAFNDLLKESNEGIKQLDGAPIFRTQAEQFKMMIEFANRFNLSVDEVNASFFAITSAQKEAAESIDETTAFYDAFIDTLDLVAKKKKEQKKIDDDELTRLKELQKLLKKQKEALEAIVDEHTEASEAAVLAAKAEIKVTQDKITAIEKVLSLKEKEKKKDKEKLESMKLEEAETVFQLELQEKLLKGEIDRHDFIIESSKLRIEAIDFLIEKEIEGTEEFKKLEVEKLELLKEIDDEKKKMREEELEDIKELGDIAAKGIIDGLNKRADAAIKTANEEISATEKQISRQEQLAAQGLENSLKFEQEQRAEALLDKLEAEKQKQRAEKISAFWNLLSNSDNVLEAIAKFGIGEAFSRTILALEEGGETPDKPTLTILGEKGKEFVSHHEATKKYLPELKAMNEGTYDAHLQDYIDNSRFIPQKIPANDLQLQNLTSEMQAMRNSFEKNLPKIETYFDASTREIINIYRYQNKKKIIHNKMPLL